MQTVAETPTFARQAATLFSIDELEDVKALLASDPHCGEIIPGTHGVRKVRVSVGGKGKSKGARVIYYFFDAEHPIFALLAYAKGRATNLTPAQQKTVGDFALSLKRDYKGS